MRTSTYLRPEDGKYESPRRLSVVEVEYSTFPHFRSLIFTKIMGIGGIILSL